MTRVGVALLSAREALAQRRAERRADRPVREFLRQFVERGDLAFDVGAHVGARTRVLRSLGAHVVAVEPLPACVAALEHSFDRDRDVVVVPRAVAAGEGAADLHVNDVGVLSSMSQDWIAATEASGRFAAVSPRWSETIRVGTTTLDALIAEHGVPTFCKLDVEGSESEVLRGLTHPIPTVSFEYTAEVRENLVASVARLASLGAQSFAFSPGETFELAAFGWVSPDDVIAKLDEADDPRAWGDVYARLLPGRQNPRLGMR